MQFLHSYDLHLSRILSKRLSINKYGTWHWKGIYLYGKAFDAPEVTEKCDTFQNMLRYLKDPEFDEVYSKLYLY
jgi:hypothetical protein